MIAWPSAAAALFLSAWAAPGHAAVDSCDATEFGAACADEQRRALLGTVLTLYELLESEALDTETVREARMFSPERFEGEDGLRKLRETEERLRSALGQVAATRDSLVYAGDAQVSCVPLAHVALATDISCAVEDFDLPDAWPVDARSDRYRMQTQVYFYPEVGVSSDRGYVVFERVEGTEALLRPVFAEVQIGQINAPRVIRTPAGEGIVGHQNSGTFMLHRQEGWRVFEVDPALVGKIEELYPLHLVNSHWIDYATFEVEAVIYQEDSAFGASSRVIRLPLSLVEGTLILASEGP
jgi:hypothetical protein